MGINRVSCIIYAAFTWVVGFAQQPRCFRPINARSRSESRGRPFRPLPPASQDPRIQLLGEACLHDDHNLGSKQQVCPYRFVDAGRQTVYSVTGRSYRLLTPTETKYVKQF